MRGLRLIFIILLATIVNFANATTKQQMIQALRMIEQETRCQLGVAAIHVESHKAIGYHADERFFMASTAKVPIAITLLRRVDRGEEWLRRPIRFNQRDAVPGSGVLYTELSRDPKVHYLPLRQLLQLMLVISDNTATDIVLRELHGPCQVAACLNRLGHHQISIKHSILDLYYATSGFPPKTKKCLHYPVMLARLVKELPMQRKFLAWKQFQKNNRDTTTPREMALLLAHLQQGEILRPRSTQALLTIMRQCQTGQQRIKGLLPKEASVAHKTGTWSIDKDQFVNFRPANQLLRFAGDVGIIDLPQNKGHVAIAIYVKSRGPNDSLRERAIALAAKRVYDYFTQ